LRAGRARGALSREVFQAERHGGAPAFAVLHGFAQPFGGAGTVILPGHDRAPDVGRELVAPAVAGPHADIGSILGARRLAHLRLPPDTAVLLVLDYAIGHHVLAHLVVVHPDRKRVANLADWRDIHRLAQHAGTVDGRVPGRVGKDREHLGRGRLNVPGDGNRFCHCHSLPLASLCCCTDATGTLKSSVTSRCGQGAIGPPGLGPAPKGFPIALLVVARLASSRRRRTRIRAREASWTRKPGSGGILDPETGLGRHPWTIPGPRRCFSRPLYPNLP